jgi:cytosine/adenosine deaminase-related metal-dependent hydrolase
LDLIIRNARLSDRGGEPLDIGIADGRIAAIGHAIAADAEVYDAQGLLACPGLIETHIHLDKSRIIGRCGTTRTSRGRSGASSNSRASSTSISISTWMSATTGNPADVVIIDAQTPEQAVAEIARPLVAFKNGKRTVAWERPQLIRPN